MPTGELRLNAEQYLMNTYTRQPISIVRGRGSKVYDLEGREYIDFVAGIAVNVLGHGHPDLVLAVQKQVQHLIHTSNLYYTEPQVRLARPWSSIRLRRKSSSVTVVRKRTKRRSNWPANIRTTSTGPIATKSSR
jgi:acetylornithine/succinyldiaminopimelate/putrescine aminotransferase